MLTAAPWPLGIKVTMGLAHLLLGWKEFSVELAYLFLGRRESESWTLLITWSSHEAEGGVPGSTG